MLRIEKSLINLFGYLGFGLGHESRLRREGLAYLTLRYSRTWLPTAMSPGFGLGHLTLLSSSCSRLELRYGDPWRYKYAPGIFVTIFKSTSVLSACRLTKVRRQPDGAGERTWTSTVLPPPAPKAGASANFATPAYSISLINITRTRLPWFYIIEYPE